MGDRVWPGWSQGCLTVILKLVPTPALGSRNPGTLFAPLPTVRRSIRHSVDTRPGQRRRCRAGRTATRRRGRRSLGVFVVYCLVALVQVAAVGVVHVRRRRSDASRRCRRAPTTTTCCVVLVCYSWGRSPKMMMHPHGEENCATWWQVMIGIAIAPSRAPSKEARGTLFLCQPCGCII